MSCYCNQSFRTAEDYRDHLPCEKPSSRAYSKGFAEANGNWITRVKQLQKKYNNPAIQQALSYLLETA